MMTMTAMPAASAATSIGAGPGRSTTGIEPDRRFVEKQHRRARSGLTWRALPPAGPWRCVAWRDAGMPEGEFWCCTRGGLVLARHRSQPSRRRPCQAKVLGQAGG